MTELDVVIIGGGPAGSTAGRLLAEWGYSVLLLTRPGSRYPSLAESLPPSCRKVFGFLGILDAMDSKGFYNSRGNTTWWGDAEGRVESFAGNSRLRGYQVLRSDLDKLLLSLARGAGALVFDDAIARRVTFGTEERVFVDFERAGRTESAEAGFVLDCSGRSGVIARKGYRKRQSGYSTLALAGVWRREGGWKLEDETHTLVETYRDGWAWSVPLNAEVRYFTIMVDYRDKAEMRPSGLAALYRAELEKASCFQKLLSGAELQSPPWSRDASLYSACAYAGPRFLLAGDAASFIDPLSSFGVKKALMSAWVGAVTVNTCLKRSEMQAAALEFFSNREARVYASYLRQSGYYFQEAAARHPHRFWTERARLPFNPQMWEPDEEELKRDPEVIAAFQALKEAPSILLRRAGTARIEKRPGIRDREIVLEEAVVSPDMPHGVRFLGNVNLPKLLEVAEKHRQVPDLFEAYNRLCPPAELPDFLGALSVLLAKKILLNKLR